MVKVSSAANVGPAWLSGANSMTTYTNCLSFVNSLSIPVPVWMEASLMGASISWDSAPPATRRSFFVFETNSSGSGSSNIISQYPDTGPVTASGNYGLMLKVGDTIAFRIGHELAHTAPAAINVPLAVSRLAAHKEAALANL